MIEQLKRLSGMNTDERCQQYDVMRYWHPDAGNKIEFVERVNSLEEAQEICSSPESSHKEGDTKNWWFLGYVNASSRTKHITAWRMFS